MLTAILKIEKKRIAINIGASNNTATSFIKAKIQQIKGNVIRNTKRLYTSSITQ